MTRAQRLSIKVPTPKQYTRERIPSVKRYKDRKNDYERHAKHRLTSIDEPHPSDAPSDDARSCMALLHLLQEELEYEDPDNGERLAEEMFARIYEDPSYYDEETCE